MEAILSQGEISEGWQWQNLSLIAGQSSAAMMKLLIHSQTSKDTWLSYIVNTMAAHGVATQGTRELTAMILTYFSWNIPIKENAFEIVSFNMWFVLVGPHCANLDFQVATYRHVPLKTRHLMT